MNLSLNIKNIFYIPLILLFFPAFAFNIPGTSFTMLYLYVFVYIILGYLILTKPKKFFQKIIKAAKETPFKYLLIALILMVINSLFLGIIGRAGIGTTMTYIFGYIFMKLLPVFLYFMYIIEDIIPFKKFFSIFILLFWINLIGGFISFFGELFNITAISAIFDFFANKRIIYTNLLGGDTSLVSSHTSFGIPRLENLFEEPAQYAQFLLLLLPFAYTYARVPLKISKSKLINKIIRLTIVPFTWISIILTLSPIYPIFAIILTVIYYLKHIINFIKKYFLLLLIFIFAVIFIFSSVDLSETYLSRIINVLTNIKSMQDFALVEPSLAARIIGAINAFCIFMQHPFAGVGVGNLPYVAYNQYLHSPVPLTIEIINKTKMLQEQGMGAFISGGFFTTILAENGGFISFLWFYFIYKLYKNAISIKNICRTCNDRLYYLFSEGIRGSIIGIFILFFYSMHYTQLTFLTVVILAVIGIYSYKIGRNENDKKNS